MARYDIAGLQYEDNAGNPLIGGKLYFYDSGTTTAKVTFSDIDETTANANPVVLDASGRAGDIYFSGSAKIIIKDSNDVTIDEKDPVTASGSAGGRLSFSVWNALSTYSASDLVTGSDSKYYRCIVASSQGQEPSATAASWTEVRFLGQWNTNQIYAIDDITQGSDGSLYTALVAQAGNDPISDLVNWRETAISSVVKDLTPQLGGNLNGDDKTVSKVKLLDYSEVTNAIGSTGGGTQSIDLTLGNAVTATVDTSANTFTFDNPTAGDELCGFTLVLTNGGSQTVTWPSSVDWPAATAPTLTAAGVDKVVFETVDGGTTWLGNLAGLAYA